MAALCNINYTFLVETNLIFYKIFISTTCNTTIMLFFQYHYIGSQLKANDDL